MCHSTLISNSTKPHLLMPARCTRKISCTSRGTSTTRSCIRFRLRARHSSAKIQSTWTKLSCNNDKCLKNNRANKFSPNKVPLASKPRPIKNSSTPTSQKSQQRLVGQAPLKNPIQYLATLMRRGATHSSQPSSSWGLNSRLTDHWRAKCWYCQIRSPDLHAPRVEVAIYKKNLKRQTLLSWNSFWLI